MFWEVGLVEVGYVVEVSVSDLEVAVGLVDVAEDVGLGLDLLHALEESLAAYIFAGVDWLGYCVKDAKWRGMGD